MTLAWRREADGTYIPVLNPGPQYYKANAEARAAREYAAAQAAMATNPAAPRYYKVNAEARAARELAAAQAAKVAAQATIQANVTAQVVKPSQWPYLKLDDNAKKIPCGQCEARIRDKDSGRLRRCRLATACRKGDKHYCWVHGYLAYPNLFRPLEKCLDAAQQSLGMQTDAVAADGTPLPAPDPNLWGPELEKAQAMLTQIQNKILALGQENQLIV